MGWYSCILKWFVSFAQKKSVNVRCKLKCRFSYHFGFRLDAIDFKRIFILKEYWTGTPHVKIDLPYCIIQVDEFFKMFSPFFFIVFFNNMWAKWDRQERTNMSGEVPWDQLLPIDMHLPRFHCVEEKYCAVYEV